MPIPRTSHRFLILAFLLFPGLACASGVTLRPGAWRMEMDFPGAADLPAQVRAQMRHALPEFCIRPGRTRPPMNPQARADHCRILHTESSGNENRTVYTCRVNGQPLRVRATVRVAANRRSFVERTQVLQGPGAGMGANTLRGTWVGPHCPADHGNPPAAGPGMPAGR